MSNRYGRDHTTLPHCVRQLPENQPRNKQEFMIRMRMIPEDPDMYFDNRGRFLYQTRCMSQELETLKASKRRSFNILQNQAGYLKSLITRQKEKNNIDIDAMRARYQKAQVKVSKTMATTKTGMHPDLPKSKPSLRTSSSPSGTTSAVSDLDLDTE